MGQARIGPGNLRLRQEHEQGRRLLLGLRPCHPSFGANGEIIGYHSNRRCPTPEAIAAITPVYKALLDEENKHEDRKAGMAAGGALLASVLEEKGIDYDQLVFSL
jgi:hypothetical protein